MLDSSQCFIAWKLQSFSAVRKHREKVWNLLVSTQQLTKWQTEAKTRKRRLHFSWKGTYLFVWCPLNTGSLEKKRLTLVFFFMWFIILCKQHGLHQSVTVTVTQSQPAELYNWVLKYRFLGFYKRSLKTSKTKFQFFSKSLKIQILDSWSLSRKLLPFNLNSCLYSYAIVCTAHGYKWCIMGKGVSCIRYSSQIFGS